MERGNEIKGGIGNSKGVRGGVIARTGLYLTRMTKRGRLATRVFEVVLRRGLILEVRGDNCVCTSSLANFANKLVQTHLHFLGQTKGEGSSQA